MPEAVAGVGAEAEARAVVPEVQWCQRYSGVGGVHGARGIQGAQCLRGVRGA